MVMYGIYGCGLLAGFSVQASLALTRSGTSLRGSKIQMNGGEGGREEEGEGRGAGKGEVGAEVWVEKGGGGERGNTTSEKDCLLGQ